MIGFVRTMAVLGLTMVATPAFAHVGHDVAGGLAAGALHPLSGLDHIAAMVAAGVWAALKGGRALWVWPAAFVGVMLAGGGLGTAGVPLPFVEPGILASVIALGLLVALAADGPLLPGAAMIGVFALCHGHAHGTEVPETASGLAYMAGFALSTALLHFAGIATALGLVRFAMRPLIRAGGVACVLVGVALALEWM